MAQNKHLEHLEDDILNNGSSGGKTSIAFLKSLGDMLSQGNQKKGIKVTTKWDGAPAIICGTDPSTGYFFVGNKSVFNKTDAKICYTDKDVDKHYPNSGLNKILKECLKYLINLGIPDVLQGDLLFTEGTKTVQMVGGEKCVTFTPNTITYAIPLNTPIGKRVNASKIGIVFHTYYSGNNIASLSAGFGVDVSSYQGHDDIAVFSSDFSDASGSANFTSTELTQFKTTISQAEGSLKQASKFLDAMAGKDKYSFNIVFKQFFNAYIRSGAMIPPVNQVVGDFAQYYNALLDKEINSKKSVKGKQKWQTVKNDGLKFIKANQRSIYMTAASYKSLTKAKLMVIRKLASVKDIGTFLKQGNGFKVTAPEGFVGIKNGTALKLVDRLEFSAANFSTDKNWDK